MSRHIQLTVINFLLVLGGQTVCSKDEGQRVLCRWTPHSRVIFGSRGTFLSLELLRMISGKESVMVIL